MFRPFNLVVFLLAINLAARAQSPGDSYIQQYSTENGMPSNGIKGMQWDERSGFLWLATEAGIVRFNGVDFRSFTRENTSSIKSERMWFMLSNSNGKIFTADVAGNIFTIRENRLEQWGEITNISNKPFAIYNLLSVSDSFFRKAMTLTVKDFNVLPFGKVVPLNDSTCLVYNGKQIFRYTISNQSTPCLPESHAEIKSVFKIGNNCFYNTAADRIFLLDPYTKSSTPVGIIDEKGSPVTLNTKSSQLLWDPGKEDPILIDREYAWSLSYHNGQILATLLSASLPLDAYIQSVRYSERMKTLFVATDSRGLVVIRKNLVTSKKRADVGIKKRNAYYSQVLLENNTILTNEGDIIGSGDKANVSLPIKGKFNFTISTIGDTTLWFVQFNSEYKMNCLHAYNYRSKTTRAYNRITLGDQTVVCTAGNDIIVTSGKGIGRIKEDSIEYLVSFSAEKERPLVYDAKEITPGVISIATCNGLLNYDLASKKLDTLYAKENYCIRTIWPYKDYLFLGTYGAGFFIKKGEVIKRMPLDKNNYLLYTHCFVPDADGYCWISTNRGLFKARLSELTDAFEKGSSNVYYHYFGKKDGMDMTELNGGCKPCALQMMDQTISFPTMDGLLWVNPQKAIPVLPDGDIYLDDVIADNHKLDAVTLKDQPLPAGTNEIIFQLAYSAWCNVENIYLDYQLNDTTHWKPVNFSSGAEIRFSNLPYGNYHLRLRKLNGFGANNFTYKDIYFSIYTPWYKKWWFNLLLLLSLVGIVLLILRIRTTQYRLRQQKLERQVDEKTRALQDQNEVLEKNNTIKNRLISIISHDIVTPLKFVTVAGQNLIAKRKLMPEELQQETIQEMTNTALELQLLSTNILNWIKYQNENRRLVKENFNLHDLVNQVLGLLNSLARQKQLQLVNNVDPQLEIRQFLEPLKIIIYNLLTNAINFTEKGDISITALQQGEDLEVSVTDKGVGMTPEQIKNIMADQFIISSANIDNRKGNGLGYLIIKDLVKMMGATLHISSEKNTGTVVSIRFPAK